MNGSDTASPGVPTRWPWRSLTLRLVTSCLALVLLALVLGRWALMQLEFRSLMAGMDRGGLARTLDPLAAQLAQEWSPDAAVPTRRTLEHALSAFLLRTARAGGPLGEERADILDELAEQPLAVTVFDGSGRVLASAPTSGWLADVDAAARDAVATASVGFPARRLPDTAAAPVGRRYLAAVPPVATPPQAWVLLELRLQSPWQRLFAPSWHERPLRLLVLLLIALAVAVAVSWLLTRRLARMAAATAAWGEGHFTARIDDRSRDELGDLARRLDRMAGQLHGQVDARAERAGRDERQRLARDLHDTVKQQAFALALQLGVLDRQATLAPDDRARLAQARHLLASLQHELLQLIDARQGDTDVSAAEGDWRARLAAFARRSGIEAVLTRFEAPAPWPAGQAAIVRRVLDEALANVERHSGARRVVVALTREGERHRLLVADDGRGLPSPLQPGMGLANLQADAAQLPDGRLQVERDGPDGTLLRLSWRA